MGHSVRQVSTMTRLAAISAFLLLADTALLPGQSLSIGVKGGVRASDDFQDAATSESRRYVVGPTATLALPLGFAIEFSRNNHEMPSLTPSATNTLLGAHNGLLSRGQRGIEYFSWQGDVLGAGTSVTPSQTPLFAFLPTVSHLFSSLASRDHFSEPTLRPR